MGVDQCDGEATYHDNSCADADIAPEGADDVDYGQRDGISLAEAVAWANEFLGATTLYLYDGAAVTTVESLP